MCHILRQVDKGMCTFCFGSGWDNSFKLEESILNIKREKPSNFDLNKCPVCSGSGRHIIIE